MEIKIKNIQSGVFIVVTLDTWLRVLVRSVGKAHTPTIDEVLLIDNLKFNLLSVSQLCDKGYKVLFCNNSCTIFYTNRDTNIFVGKR